MPVPADRNAEESKHPYAQVRGWVGVQPEEREAVGPATSCIPILLPSAPVLPALSSRVGWVRIFSKQQGEDETWWFSRAKPSACG